MIRSPLLLAELSGCVVTTCQTSLPGQNNRESDLYRGGDEKQTPARSESSGVWSCSGVILERSLGLVICHATVFIPFLKEKDHYLSPCDRDALSADDFSSDLFVQVECPFEQTLDAEQRAPFNRAASDQRSRLGLVPVSKPQTQRTQRKAELLMLLPCPEFRVAFSRLFRKEDGWVFSNEEEKEYGEFQKDMAYLHWFAVLKLEIPLTKAKSQMNIMRPFNLVKGRKVFACGSPFGSFYPDIFLNTISKGVLSNTAGDGNVVLLTDARCLPGSEGGGIFVLENGKLHLVGIIVAPLCWKANEWVGLTVACSISHIIDNIMKLFHQADVVKSELAALEVGYSMVDKSKRAVRPSEHLMAVVVLVDSGQSWGSGVLVKSKLVLTCRHVVRDSAKVSVKIQNATMTNGDGSAFGR